MARSTLFGYTVEEDEGKLVITINGLIADGLIRQISTEAESGKGATLLKLLQLGSLQRLMTEPSGAVGEGPLSLEEIFSQNIDQTFAAFEQQINELRTNLTDVAPAAAPSAPTKRETGKATAKE